MREKPGIVDLSVGETNIPIPKEALSAALGEMKSEKKSGYGRPEGVQELRELIARREGCDLEDVVIGSGAKAIIFSLLSVLSKPGDTLSFPIPSWDAYPLMAKQLRLKAKPQHTYLENHWDFESGSDPDSMLDGKLAIICNPQNPTSRVYSEPLMRRFLEIAERRRMPIILDETYKGLVFAPTKILRYDYENTIRVRSFSKEFNLAGWRLGYAVAPKEIAKKAIRTHHLFNSCTPEFIQRAGIACLENERKILASNKKIWKTRLEAISKPLRRTGFRFAEPEAGMYIFGTHEQMTDADRFVSKLLAQGLKLAPGSDFGGRRYLRFVRICLNQSEQILRASAQIMGEAVE